MTAIVLTLLVTPTAQTSSSAPRSPSFPESGDPAFATESRTSGDVARQVTLAGRGAGNTEAAVSERLVDSPSAQGVHRAGRAGPLSGLSVSVTSVLPRSETCRSARAGLRWYRGRYLSHRAKMGQRRGAGLSTIRSARNHAVACPRIRVLASRWRTKAYAARVTYERWAAVHVLRDPEVRPGNDAWEKAVQEAQRAYPGTRGWLLSCSASEGGWGRWVPNSDGAPPGGWLQFYESTFWRMWATAKVDVGRRGFKVPRSAHSWYSPLGQALAGAWALTNGRRHEWAGYGC